MKRFGALVLAAAMVLGAVLVRDRIEDDGSGGASGDALRLRCAAELRSVCSTLVDDLGDDGDGIEVEYQTPGATADALVELAAGEDTGFDLWLTTSPWPGIVEDGRSRSGGRGEVLGAPSEVLARSPVVIAARAERLREHCPDGIDWNCVGDAASSGERIGLSSPNRGDGLTVLASAAADRFGTTEYASNDFDEDPDFGGWFRALTSSSHDQNLGDQTPLRAGVAASGRFSVVGALEADVASLPRGWDPYDPTYPEPVVTADVVLVPSSLAGGERGLDRLGGRDAVLDALSAAGWRAEGRALPDTAGDAPQLPEEAGTPAPGVLQALRERWKD